MSKFKNLILCLIIVAAANGPGVPDNYPPEPPKGPNGPAQPGWPGPVSK